MTVVLGIIAVISILFSAAAAMSAFAGGTDIQWVLAGVFATCATVALTGIAICSRLPEPPRKPSELDAG